MIQTPGVVFTTLHFLCNLWTDLDSVLNLLDLFVCAFDGHTYLNSFKIYSELNNLYI
jgi:hypothetical protein